MKPHDLVDGVCRNCEHDVRSALRVFDVLPELASLGAISPDVANYYVDLEERRFSHSETVELICCNSDDIDPEAVISLLDDLSAIDRLFKMVISAQIAALEGLANGNDVTEKTDALRHRSHEIRLAAFEAAMILKGYTDEDAGYLVITVSVPGFLVAADSGMPASDSDEPESMSANA
jgi:hypothetical protein